MRTVTAGNHPRHNMWFENSINYEKRVVTHKVLGLFSSLSICHSLGLYDEYAGGFEQWLKYGN